MVGAGRAWRGAGATRAEREDGQTEVLPPDRPTPGTRAGSRWNPLGNVAGDLLRCSPGGSSATQSDCCRGRAAALSAPHELQGYNSLPHASGVTSWPRARVHRPGGPCLHPLPAPDRDPSAEAVCAHVLHRGQELRCSLGDQALH